MVDENQVDETEAALLEKRQHRLNEFQKVLDSLESVKDEKKRLWQQIYESAMIEWEEAYALYSNLKPATQGDYHNHSLHGLLLTKYLERMNKANDQNLRIAELIEKAGSHGPSLNKSDIYDQIAKK